MLLRNIFGLNPFGLNPFGAFSPYKANRALLGDTRRNYVPVALDSGAAKLLL